MRPEYVILHRGQSQGRVGSKDMSQMIWKQKDGSGGKGTTWGVFEGTEVRGFKGHV